MESPTGPTAVPDTSKDAASNTTVSAQEGSVCLAPQIKSTSVSGDMNFTVNNTPGQVPARTHEADVAAAKTKEIGFNMGYTYKKK